MWPCRRRATANMFCADICWHLSLTVAPFFCTQIACIYFQGCSLQDFSTWDKLEYGMIKLMMKLRRLIAAHYLIFCRRLYTSTEPAGGRCNPWKYQLNLDIDELEKLWQMRFEQGACLCSRSEQNVPAIQCLRTLNVLKRKR